MANEEKKLPVEAELLDNLGKIAYTLDRAYLPNLESEYDVLPFDDFNKVEELIEKTDRLGNVLRDNQGQPITEEKSFALIKYVNNIRALHVKRWVYDKEEKIGDCFKNVLSTFAGSENTLAAVLYRTPKGTDMYFVMKNAGAVSGEVAEKELDLLAASLKGNFPGSKVETIEESKDGETTKGLFHFDEMKSVSCLSNIPSEKSEDYICQGIDKLLNGIVPKTDDESYYVVILADALSQTALREVLSGYEEMATAITPFAGYQFQVGKSDTDTTGEMQSMTHTDGISDSVTKTHSLNAGLNGSLNFGSTIGKTISKFGLLTRVKKWASRFAYGGETASNTENSSKGLNIGASLGYGYSWGKTHGTSSSDAETTGTNHSVSLGTSENTTYTYKSYMVTDLIERLETTIKRINESQSTGLWKAASYVLTANPTQSKAIANFLRSLTQGDESYIEPSAIQTWAKNENAKDTTPFGEIVKYLRHFTHPIFVNLVDGMPVTPTANVSTTELSNVFAFPRYSVQGLPVMQCARFGREPHSYRNLEGDVDLGCTYHMHEEGKNRVCLDRKELTAHTFITGSTGAGKSNTIYHLLSQLCPIGKDTTHFLVIEPAKGEYKNELGGGGNVEVYGTNPKEAKLLHLNPFSFPNGIHGIHVLEHIDRLVEVFNACWPMYAAMPAVLKDAMESSYISCGWDLTRSKCAFEPDRFPTFGTLLQMLPEILERSAYSQDTKSDYTGALVTRVKSLTNGINGQIFCSDDEVPNKDLFDKNVIVDLSRVGSMETKALLMGILMIKLQEYRMNQAKGPNAPLEHITVLEEAHNLLRRTSAEQSQESSNLQGKSVEMLANAIAEMRTYGEGFIIADQAPGLLDMAVIRNTNTKIIMRLPDESDRQLVGRAAGLNDDQIVELAKLDTGVAAVFQSHWLEPVLCKVDYFKKTGSYTPPTPSEKGNSPLIEKLVTRIVHGVDDSRELTTDEVDQLRIWVDRFNTGRDVKKMLLRLLDENVDLAEQERGYLLYCLTRGDVFIEQTRNITHRDLVQSVVDRRIMDSLQVSAVLAEEVRKLVYRYAAERVLPDEAQFNDLLYYGGIK